MTAQRFKVIQILLEAAIPLMGLYLWGWDLFFIVLFYVLDLIADHTFLHVKSKKILDEQRSGKDVWFRYSVLSVLVLAAVLLLALVTIQNLHPEMNLLAQAEIFWTYEELGLQQGYILLPLVFFAAYQQYKMEFLFTGKFRTIQQEAIWKPVMNAYLLILAFCGLAFGLSFWVVWLDAVYVLAIVVLSSLFKLWGSRK